jgi:hypothetical protein
VGLGVAGVQPEQARRIEEVGLVSLRYGVLGAVGAGIVFVATQPIDMRLSFDRIAGIVRAQLGREPRTDAVFGGV